MANISYTAFTPDIIPVVPGCPDFTIESAVRDAAIEFCAKSEVHRVDLDPATVVAGQYEYEFETPKQTTTHSVKSVTLDGCTLKAKTRKALEQMLPNWRTERSTPLYYTTVSPRLLYIAPVPQNKVSLGLRIQVALKPTRISTVIDGDIFEDYAETIRYCAIAKLLRIPRKDWTDPRSSQEYYALYQMGLEEARIRAEQSDLKAETIVQYGGL